MQSKDTSLLENVSSNLKRRIKEKTQCTSLVEAFVAVAKKENKTTYPALSLASSLSTTTATAETALEWTNLFLQSSSLSNKSTSFPSPSEVAMAKSFLVNFITQSSFDDVVAPALGLKMRAHPESVLPLLEVILTCLLDSTTGIDGASQLLENATLLPSTMKHLKSSKPEMKWVAWRVLIILSKLNGGKNNVQSVTLVVEGVCDALATGTGATALNTSELRAGGYAALEGVAGYVMDVIGGEDGFSDSNDDDATKSIQKLADRALGVLVGCVVKDKNATAAATGVTPLASIDGRTPPVLIPKEVGYNATISWMFLSKRVLQTDKASGYDKALEYLAEPVTKYSLKDGEFRFRYGGLVVPPSSSYLGCTLTGSRVAPSSFSNGAKSETFLESLVVDLIEKKCIQKSLEGIVDAAVKKHSTSDAVAQVDGALATFLMVLYSQSKSSFSLSASVNKVVNAGATLKVGETSFLYSSSMLELAKSDVLVNYILHRTIALHCKVASTAEGDASGKSLVRVMENVPKNELPGSTSSISAATKALAVCVANPLCSSTQLSVAYSSAQSSLKTVVTYSPSTANASDALIFALFSHMNECSLKNEDARTTVNESHSYEPVDETFNKLPGDSRGKLSEDASHNCVRHAAKSLVATVTYSDAMWRALLLTHSGTSMRSNRKVRVALVSHMLDELKDAVVPFAEKSGGVDSMVDSFAQFIALYASSSKSADGKLAISLTMHDAALSLITTLGGIAGSFDSEFDDSEDEEKRPYSFAHTLCILVLPKYLIIHLTESMTSLESMTKEDIALFKSPIGVLYGGSGDGEKEGGSFAGSKAPAVEKKKAGRKKGGGFNAFEDEEWEKQVKKDLAKKKAQESTFVSSPGTTLSPQEKELLNQQTAKREEMSGVLRGSFPRSLATIRCLCESDIEVGNASLPVFGMIVIKAVVSTCAALSSLFELQNECFDTLSALAASVYEIEETHAPTLARALTVSFRSDSEHSEKDKELSVSALPSPCPSAACSIFEMEDYGDCLCGNSFGFLFPILRAALTGPRNIPGCDAALIVLERHCSMLAGDEVDAGIKSLRREMASTVLELLSHDRSQTFVNPTPYEALISCYATDEDTAGPALSASEIAPLLGECGALGNENNRVAAMETLASIGKQHPKLVKSNPLIENRIWLNCYASQERVKSAARKAWLVAHGNTTDDVDGTPLDPPSKMYAVPLLPLLSHDDKSIASAAAASLAYAMGMHSDSAEKNIVKLCNTYISSFPAPSEEDQPTAAKASPFPVQAPPMAKPVKKIIDTGLKKKPKKTSNVSASLAKITGGPAPKKTAAAKKLLAKANAPKERTLDQDALMGQFVTQSSTKKETGEADSDSKVAIRMGVVRAVSSLTDPSAKVKMDLPVLKILLGFLIAFGLGDGNEDVRNESRNAARDIVAYYGSSEDVISFFLPQFESVLTTGKADEKCIEPLSPDKVPKSIAASDYRKEGVVVSLGSIALHLNDDADADKIDDIIDMLLNALKTPVSSEEALHLSSGSRVSRCLLCSHFTLRCTFLMQVRGCPS